MMDQFVEPTSYVKEPFPGNLLNSQAPPERISNASIFPITLL